MTLTEMLQTPEKYIPFGLYCCNFTNNNICPFWDSKEGEFPQKEDGYCYLLQKSDWDLNEESSKTAKIIYSHDGSMTGMTIADLEDDNDIDTISGKKCHFPMSLLWDQCKECEINMDNPEDIELVKFELNEGEEK